jgi:hypothetical protein
MEGIRLTFNKYFLRYRNQNLLILARSILEAVEPWARINFRSFTSHEFEKALIEEPANQNCLLLTGNTITRDDLKLFHRHLDATIKKVEIKKLPEVVEIPKPFVEEVLSPVQVSSQLEDFFET